MPSNSKPTRKHPKSKPDKTGEMLDLNSPAAAAAFWVAAKAYTKRATETKETAIRTLHREGILTKDGKFTKAYSSQS